MTLIPYRPHEIDALALRLFDAAARVRKLSLDARREQIDRVRFHSGKLDEWLKHIELWIHRADAQLTAAVYERRGAELAHAQPVEPEATPSRRKSRR